MKIDKVSAMTSQRVVAITVNLVQVREKNLSMVPDVFIRFVNFESKVYITRFDFVEDYSTKTSMIFGETYCNEGECKFKALGQGYAGGLRALAIQHGVSFQ